jgi:hypothetical protein
MEIVLTINTITAICVAISAAIPAIIGLAATVARFLPPPDQEGFAAKAHKIINAIGQNSGYAENKSAE